MKSVSGKRMCKILQAKGWVHTRTSSSHFIFEKPGAARPVPVPVHANRDLPRRTQHDIMKQAGLTEADL